MFYLDEKLLNIDFFFVVFVNILEILISIFWNIGITNFSK